MRFAPSFILSSCVALILGSDGIDCACTKAGTTWTCSNVADWVSILKAGTSSGDSIILLSGSYSTTAKFTIAGSNLNIQAQVAGSVTFTGDIQITNTAPGTTFTGFRFIGGTSGAGAGTTIKAYSNDCVYSQLHFENFLAQHYIVVGATSYRNEIHHNTVTLKPDAGGANQGSAFDNQANTGSALLTWYHHNVFYNFAGPGGDAGNEPIRLGAGTYSTMNAGSLVEHNYFNNTGGGDSETVSVKSMNNIIRYNTFTKQHNAQLTFRNGYYNEAYGNFFIDAGGVRFKAASNIYIWNNYFETCYVNLITQNNGGSCIYYDQTGIATDLQNINVIHNTFYQSGPVDFGITGTTIQTKIANNVFQAPTSNNFQDYPTTGVNFYSNIYTGGVGISPVPSGLSLSDAKLSWNADGYYSPQDSTSGVKVSEWSGYSPLPSFAVPAGALADDYTVQYDIAYQSRTSNKDLGASQAVGAPTSYVPSTINKPYTWADVKNHVVGNNYATY